MTAGTDGETLDGFSLKTIREIIEAMRAESFQFQPLRQSFIAKANGKMRKLGIPSARDKIVVGTPQGSIASPILANVYLHELDEYVETLRAKHEKGKVKARNPLYHALSEKKRRMAKQGRAKTREFRELTARLPALPSVVADDPHFIRLKYLRYADDWIIGLCGSQKLAAEIKQEIKQFLKETLKLTLSEEKTRITNAKAEEAFFLGTILKI